MTSPAKLPKWRRLAIAALCIMATICLFPVTGFSKTHKLYPIADATVYVGSEFNWGADVNLTVANNPAYSYLKFDLSSIPATEKITGATLNAFCSQGLPSLGFAIQLQAVSDTSWTETGITGEAGNYPWPLGTVIDTYVTGKQDEYNQWTVGAAYLPRGLVSYALTLSSGAIAVYNSKENPSNKPYLQITTVESTAAPRYSYLNLGILPGGNYSDPWSINNSGSVVGTSGNSSTFGRAFLKTGSQPMVNLGTLEGDASHGYDINDAGQVVGEAQNEAGEWRAFLKNPGELMVDLELGNGSFATAINASGQVVGQAQNSSGVWRAFLKPLGQPVEDLGTLGGEEHTSFANEINASGHVVGQAQNSSGFGRAFLKPFGQPMVDLGTLGGNESEAMHINSSGQVVGGAQNSSGAWRAFLKSPGQLMQDLGTLGGNESGVVGFNNVGQIVGSAFVDSSTEHPFLWDNGFMYDLNNITVNLPSGVTLLTAHAINDQGWIVGQDSNSTAFLLIPQRSISGLLQLLLLD